VPYEKSSQFTLVLSFVILQSAMKVFRAIFSITFTNQHVIFMSFFWFVSNSQPTYQPWYYNPNNIFSFLHIIKFLRVLSCRSCVSCSNITPAYKYECILFKADLPQRGVFSTQSSYSCSWVFVFIFKKYLKME